MLITTPSEDLEEFLGSYGPVDPKIKPIRIVGFDTEDDSKGTPISFAFHDGKKSFYTKDADEAVDYVYNSRLITCFVAHNLEYDIGNLFKHCDFKYIHEMIYASKLLTATLWGTNNYFLNSSSFFQGPLKDMGELVGFPKMEGNPFDKNYNIRDAQICQVFMSKIQSRLHNMGVNLGVSIGQLSMSVYRRRFMRGKVITFNKPDIVDKAYYGGRVEVFYKGIVKEKIYVADINSSYPDVMRNNNYPDTAFIEKSSLETHNFGYGKFTIDIPKDVFIPPLPFRSESGRLFFPTGVITGWWTYAEVRAAVRIGCRVLSEHEGLGTNRGVSPYRGFIDYFWDERQIVKARLIKNKNDLDAKFESLFLKLIMNNRYGKDAQHKDSVLMTRYRLAEAKIAELKGVRECKIGPFYGYTIPREKAPRTANYLWGAYTTSYARISLLEKMYAVHRAGGRLLYCDTDSVMFTGEHALSALPIGEGLGELGVEIYDLAVFRQAKGYLLFEGVSSSLKTRELDAFAVDKVACKGVPTQYALEFMREGLIRALKPMRLKEAQIRLHARTNKDKNDAFLRDIGVNVWRDVPKTMNSVYIKRKGENGVTWPVDVTEIPGLEDGAYRTPARLTELDDFNIRPQEQKGQAFRNIVIPKNWHRRTKKIKETEDFFSAQKMQFLNVMQLKDLRPGEVWFSGKAIQLKKGKFGEFFVLRLKKFMNVDVKTKNILAALPKKFLAAYYEKEKENIFGKSIEIILARDYNLNTSLEYSVSVN